MANEGESAAGKGQSTNTRAAATKVFNTTELLEAILLMLHPRDLLLSQRVCKQWSCVIHGSVSIKKALFLESGEVSAADSGKTALENAINSHLQWFALFDPAILRVSERLVDLERLIEPVALCGVQLNHLLTPPDIEIKPFPKELHRYRHSTMIVWDLKPQLLFSHDLASCRRMSLTQPPVSLRIFDVDFCSLWAMEPRHPRPHRENRRYRNARTFGELIDAVEEKLEGEERLKIMKCLRIMVRVGPEEVKAWVEEYGGK